MQNKLKVLDTFAGAGGFSLGFELAGCEITGAIEQDKWACDTFQYNHSSAKVITADVMDLSDDFLIATFKKDKPDIVLGGPPCQGFSICNKNSGDPKDPRNTLFEEFIRIGRLFEPKLMVMENVPNLKKARTITGEQVIDIIESELKKLGYHVYSDILEATSYGAPQIRKRLFVVASKIELEHPFPFPTHTAERFGLHLFKNDTLQQCPSLWDVISDLPDIEAGGGAEEMEYDKEPINDFQRVLRADSKKLYNHTAMNHSKRLVERFASMKCGDSTSDVPEHLKPFQRNGNGVLAKKTYDQNNRRMHPDKPCHTVPASFYANFVHPFKNRNFTAREGARIQSFPDRYVFKGKPTVVSHKLLSREGRLNERHLCQYNQIGNAVPPLFAKAIAENLLNQI